ncbi:MAG: ferric-dicitrate binding protein FerR (iron transport regulator) [Myxococcota bacterium]|jgi:ferric-dicitrate binding protein FerR (iron transport regulator)
MHDYRHTLRQVAEDTAPTGDELRRVTARLNAQIAPTTNLLAQLDPVSPFEVERLRRRLEGPRLRQPTRWALPAAGSVGLAAAAVVFGVFTAPEPAPATEIELVATELASAAPSSLLRLDYEGVGRVSGADPAWEVSWERGTVHVDVTPDAGAEVSVRTRDAVVRVVGTAFTVTRDELGTAVDVDHGRVELTCMLGGVLELTAGGHHVCLPATAAGLLGRALALEDRGAPPEQRLEALDAALSLTAPEPVLAEVLATRVRPLLDAGRHDDALQAAEAYVDRGGGREDELRHVAAHLALSLHGCDRAVPHLRALVTPSPEESAHLAACGDD